MHLNAIIFKTLIKNGYSQVGNKRVWDVSDSKLWCLTPELSKGYEKFENYTPYRQNVTKEEMALLKSHVKEIFNEVGQTSFNVLDVGSGDGSKAAHLLKMIPGKSKLRYIAFDLSEYFLEQVPSNIKKGNPECVNEVKIVKDSFDNLPDHAGLLRSSQYPRTLTLLLGSTLSHVDVHDLLFSLSGQMFPGDCMVIGNGLRVGKRFVNIKKYETSYLKDWFMHIIKGLGFTEAEVEYKPRFTHSRLELCYVLKTDKKVELEGKTVYFKEGDEIVAAIQYKFFAKELDSICKKYFSKVHMVLSKDKEYCLLICKK